MIHFCFVFWFSSWSHSLILTQKVRSMDYELEYFSYSYQVIYFLRKCFKCICFPFSTYNGKTFVLTRSPLHVWRTESPRVPSLMPLSSHRWQITSRGPLLCLHILSVPSYCTLALCCIKRHPKQLLQQDSFLTFCPPAVTQRVGLRQKK